MPEYLLMGDIHLSDRPPSACTDSYQDDIFDLLRAVGTIAEERNAEAVIWAGDIFHHKTPGRTSHRTVMTLIDIINGYPCRVEIVPGNHDMQSDRLDSIDDTQPLGVILASGAARLLKGWMLPTDKLDRHGWLDPVYGVPWLMRFDDDSVNAALAEYREYPTDTAYDLVVTHAPLYPLGRELAYENYPADAWATAMNNEGSVFYGHVHEPHGIHFAGGVAFCNPGALSRGSLHEHNLTRPVQIASWQSDTGLFELVPVPHKPAAEVFRLAETAQVRSARVELNQFLESVGVARIETTSIEAVMAHIRGLDLGPRLTNAILTLLEEAST